ncbi:hypothetical protein PVAND_015301 [Polypedilum vanderplanki]|uniref:G domain-containing protein n=1 Tax=Polypedilum vanderplanki TaxID=319348 RepID=A0A9J6BBW0_POLVA|nr:hypothetical protein PVAND_015301 [Polypedilum vanderplanki]
MSKSTQPIILKKSENNKNQRQKNEPQQPKILTKSNSTNETNQNHQEKNSQQQQHQQKKETEIQSEVQPMKNSHRFMFPHFNIDSKTFDFLDNDNTDFLVVAAIGVKNVGKSTLMNIIADQQYVKLNDGNFVGFSSDHEIFPTVKEQVYEGSTIDMFITTDRVFVLDPSPLAHNVQRRDMIVAESDDLKMLIILLQICHLIVIVHSGYPDLTLLRLLHLADSIIPSDVKHRPNFLYVGNNMQPGTKIKKLDENENHLMIPNLKHSSIFLHHDVQQTIEEYQEEVFMLKRYSLLNGDSDEIFNEKRWSQRVMQVMETLKGDYFLRKYDGLREKYHQAVDN